MNTVEKESAVEVNKYFDRDLSWLTFNYRVLMEANDPKVPLFERLRFLAIYSSNLDEFFRVRVADINRLAKIDKKKLNKALDVQPKKILENIKSVVHNQQEEFGHILRNKVLVELEQQGFRVHRGGQLTEEQEKACLNHFKNKVLAFLQPYIFNLTNREPFLNNRGLYYALRLEHKRTKVEYFAYVNIPSNRIPRFYELPSDRVPHVYIYLENLISMHFDFVFPDFEVLEHKTIKMNKDADLNIDDEYSGDLVEKIQRQIAKRNVGQPSRFMFDSSMSEELLNCFIREFNLTDEELVYGGPYHNNFDFLQISNPLGPELEYDKFTPVSNPEIDNHRSIFKAIDESDRLLHFPYHSYDYVLQFFNQAAIDPYVTEIKVTFYRMASNSYIGDALISAANNGKMVTVFIELKARFDEENNLMWAERMKKAGIRIIYSIPGIKVHAKIALVKKVTTKGKAKLYSFFGTGNMNEKTAKIYSDFGLLTSNKAMGVELDDVFKYLHRRKQPAEFKHILVSQFNMVSSLKGLIDREIEHVKNGNPGHIIIKLNNIEEKSMIDKLYEASQAGVQIRMLVRSICCIRPGIKGLSENIRITRIVDRFLEHARTFIFHNNGDEQIYMGSADWMIRNLHSRVEVTFPVNHPSLKETIKKIVQLQLDDNVKAVELNSNIENVRKESGEKEEIRAQKETYKFVRSVGSFETLYSNDESE